MSIWAALTEQSPDDEFPYESFVRTKLQAWRQWMRGDGVAGMKGKQLVLDDETALRIQNRSDDFRLPMAVADAERTNRAVIELRNTDNVAWRALECYHFESMATRRIARACRKHHTDVPDILVRGHESLREFYIHDTGRISINPAPVVA